MRTITLSDKSFPAAHVGERVDRLSIPLSEFMTPLLALDGAAIESNIEVMSRWVRAHGMELMPHGKTTMAPALWRRQLDASATGITVATGWQAGVALRAGVPTVQIANACLDPQALRLTASWLGAHPEQDVVAWVDSLAAVELMEQALDDDTPLGVLVELGAVGGRTGVRDPDTVATIARRIAESSRLTLRGVAGYEGALAHDRSPMSLRAVREFCNNMVDALESVRPMVDGTPWLTAGGSAYFDIVAESFHAVLDARVILRSGAYLTHDDGFYQGISPLDASRSSSGATSLRSAMRGYARVVSCPEPGLALLDGGKRDFPYDEGLPVPLAVARRLGGPEERIHAQITALNDQHAFLRWEGNDEVVKQGDVVTLGLSHPCTAFDKWGLIPVLDNENTVYEAIETVF